MQVLLFEIGEGRFALPTSQILEIVPYVRLKKIPKAAPHVAGIMNYRGRPVPVLDLKALNEGLPCEERLSTRIIVVDYPVREGENKPLGLIGERVTETVKIRQEAAPASGIIMDEALYTEGAGYDKEEMVQWLDLRRMIPPHLVAELFQE